MTMFDKNWLISVFISGLVINIIASYMITFINKKFFKWKGDISEKRKRKFQQIVSTVRIDIMFYKLELIFKVLKLLIMIIISLLVITSLNYLVDLVQNETINHVLRFLFIIVYLFLAVGIVYNYSTSIRRLELAIKQVKKEEKEENPVVNRVARPTSKR